MAANIETMFSVRETPWHNQGIVIKEAPTSEEAIKIAPSCFEDLRDENNLQNT